jgi:hypothetical protein
MLPESIAFFPRIRPAGDGVPTIDEGGSGLMACVGSPTAPGSSSWATRMGADELNLGRLDGHLNGVQKLDR